MRMTIPKLLPIVLLLIILFFGGMLMTASMQDVDNSTIQDTPMEGVYNVTTTMWTAHATIFHFIILACAIATVITAVWYLVRFKR